MKSIKKAVHNKNDNLYTPKILAESILPYVEEFYYKHESQTLTIWCPFDTADSEIVIALNSLSEKLDNKIKLIVTHISNGDDFFTMDIPECDLVVSNPPFSRKLDVLKRLEHFVIPYCLLINLMALNYNEINYFLADNCDYDSKHLLIVDKKVSFDGRTSSFNTSWIINDYRNCTSVRFVHLQHDNRGVNFVPSKMLCSNCKLCDGTLSGLECINKRGLNVK